MTFTFDYDAPCKIALGNVYYVVMPCDHQSYNAPCKVCNDTHSITVNGAIFVCPACSDKVADCEVNEYFVCQCRVSRITFEPCDTNGSPEMKVGLCDNRYGYADEYDEEEVDLNTFNSLFVKPDAMPDVIRDYAICDDYSLACKVAARLTDLQRKKLQEYNAENGTDFQFGLRAENDKKSV